MTATVAVGVVTTGKASVDESRLTGEAMPIEKEQGASVKSGAIVASGCATHEGEQSFEGVTVIRAISGTWR